MADIAPSADFSDEQKRYLEGFASGLNVGRAAHQLSAARVPAAAPAKAQPEPVGPDAVHIKAQDRVLEEGKKLSDQEKFKRELNPLDAYDRLKTQAAANEPPKPDDNFRWRFFGLFYVAPNQKSYMCRLRIPNGILTHWQFAGLADLPQRHGGGYSHVTTRANLQVRGSSPRMRSPWWRASSISACARAAPAPTISATSPAPRRRASIRRS